MERQNSESSRVEAFSDGVFAIAITLLILEIRVPRELQPGQLGAALLKLWPSYLAFLTSFGTIGIMWLNHHRLFTLIDRIDDGLIGLNTLLLLGVTWIPFPTALFAQYLRQTDQFTAGAVYAGSFLVIAIIFNILWRYAIRNKLVADHINVSAISRQYFLGPVFYLIAFAIAFVNAVACLLFTAALAMYFALPPRFWQRK